MHPALNYHNDKNPSVLQFLVTHLLFLLIWRQVPILTRIYQSCWMRLRTPLMRIHITCYNCTAKDSWCFYINDLIKHGSEAQVRCASNQCFIAEYLCDDQNSDDCLVEYNNAVNNITLDYFYRRCATEGGEEPLRTRCKLCCNADAAGNYTFSALKDCYTNEEFDGFYDPTFTSTRCVCETNLCNYECNTADIRMIRNDLLSVLTSLYLFSYFLM